MQNLAPRNAVSAVKGLASSPAMINRFRDVLGDKAPQFLASVVSAVNANSALRSAEPMSVMASAMVAATLDLDVIPGLGFAALVPYRNHGSSQCQFQIMTKGLVQLALRSGQYKDINTGVIYEDEYDGMDMITGEPKYHEVRDGQRDHDDEAHIAGYFAFIELLNGFRKVEFWPMAKIIAHGKRYSKSFGSGPWNDNFPAMARKTVLKSVLSHWGILSVKMTKAIVSDQAVFHTPDEDATPEYADLPDGMGITTEGEVVPNGGSNGAKKDMPGKASEPQPAADVPDPIQKAEAEKPQPAPVQAPVDGPAQNEGPEEYPFEGGPERFDDDGLRRFGL